MNLGVLIGEEKLLPLALIAKTYITYDEEKAFQKLWEFTYAPLTAYANENLKSMNYSTSHSTYIRDYIFSLMNRDDVIKIKRTISNDELFKIFSNDKFAVQRLDKVIEQTFANSSLRELEKICYQLNSRTNSGVLEGLKALGLSEKESMYYFDYSKGIFNYFSLKYENYKQKSHCDENKKETLLDLITKLYDNKDIVKDFIEETKLFSKQYEINFENEHSIINLFKIYETLSSSKVIIEKCEKLKELEINPDWVLNNIDVVSKLLSDDFYNSFSN